MKRVVPTLTIAALAGALLTSGSIMTASASTVTNGTVHVFAYGDGEGVGSTVVLTGAIGEGCGSVGVTYAARGMRPWA
jgi:hypothetical protein